MDKTAVWAPADSEEYQLFRQAAVNGDKQRLATALKPNIDVNALFGDGFEGHSVLHENAARGHVDVLQYLLSHGAALDILDKNQSGCSTPLYYAAKCAQVGATRVFLDAGADITVKGPNDNTILSAVLPDSVQVTQSQINTIALLLDRGFDVNARASTYGPTVLEQAIKAASHTLIMMLLDRGATLEGSLGIAAEFNENADTVSFLIDQGAKDSNSYALSRAACWNKTDMAIALLARASEPASGSSPSGALQKAALMGHLDMVNMLLDSGLGVNGTDEVGQTPLIAASRADRPLPGLVQTLLSRGADVAARTLHVPGGPYEAGDTPLHASAWRNDPEIVRLLLRAGADVTCRNAAGETPLIKFALKMTSHTIHHEDSNPRLDTFRMLLEAGSDVNASDIKGRTALHVLAADRFFDRDGNRPKAIRLLLASGIERSARNAEDRTAAELLQPGEIELAHILDPRMKGPSSTQE